jgi:hypothetical protein
VLVIGATTAFFMGLLGIVQNDIKRVVAYSTLSQLGYMTVALGASAYAAGIFHLMTHAFFKALLFLAAGSVIIAMHHEQDIRRMGGLKRYMPITYWTALIGSLALIGFPGLLRLLLQGRHHRGGPPCRAARRRLRLRLRAARRVHHRAVQLPHVLPGVSWRRSASTRTPAAICTRALGGDRTAGVAGHSVGDHRLARHGALLFGGFFGESIQVSPRATRSPRWRRVAPRRPPRCLRMRW